MLNFGFHQALNIPSQKIIFLTEPISMKFVQKKGVHAFGNIRPIQNGAKRPLIWFRISCHSWYSSTGNFFVGGILQLVCKLDAFTKNYPRILEQLS